MSLCNVLSTNDTFSIIFKYEHNDKERVFKFDRNTNETLHNLLKRMEINLQKAFQNKNNKSLNNDFIIKFFYDNQIVDLNMKNKDFWRDGSEMHINGRIYSIKLNYPHIVDMKLSNIILTGYFIYPYMNITFGNISQSEFIWFKKKNFNDENEWKQIHVGFLYEIQRDDLDHLLKVVCTPKLGTKEGLSREAVSLKTISHGPINCPFEKRFIYTKTPLEYPQFRVVSYNLLADLYVNSEYSQNILYSYCNNSYLNFEYRKTLLIKELIGYNSDLYFLQELDSIFYQKGLEPILNSIGFESYFVSKQMNSEGLCIFYKKSKFDLIKQEAHIYSDLLLNFDSLKFLRRKISENENLYNRIKNLKNTFQIVLLKSTVDKSKLLLLCNLHLYSKEDADHIRLIQTFITLNYIEYYLDQICKNQNYLYCKLSVILSGDFNSTPEFGVVKLIQNKRIDSSLDDFKNNHLEIIKDFILEHRLILQSACGFPEYTHFTQHFSGCLDYIFYDCINLKVIDIVPMPNHEDVIKEIALPNEKIPSDHLPLICTFSWN